MSDEELKRLPSLQGYVNLSELKRIALATIASSGLINVVLMVLVSVLQQSDKWLTGTRDYAGRLDPDTLPQQLLP
jgi:hypothetical protein